MSGPTSNPAGFAVAQCYTPHELERPVEAGESSGLVGVGGDSEFRAEGVTLYLADCRDVQLAADLLISDPPYGTGKYEHDDDASVVQILRAWPRKAVFGYPETLCEWAASLGKPDEWVTWWPTNKQIRRIGKLTSETEAVAIWGETFEVPMRPRSQDKWAQSITAKRGLAADEAKMGDVWRDASPGMCCNSHLRQHPNEKPESLMAKLVKLCSVEGETICDPYMGSGTTGVVAVRYGRRFVGVEKDPAHFETAVRRIRAELSQGVLPLGGGGAELVRERADGTTREGYNE